jgi:fucose permease
MGNNKVGGELRMLVVFFMLGAVLGMILMSLLIAAGDADREQERVIMRMKIDKLEKEVEYYKRKLEKR